MNFRDTQLGIVLEDIKRAYASGYPIVYLPTNQEDLVNELLYSPLCQNQILPGVKAIDGKTKDDCHDSLFSLCEDSDYCPVNYKINELADFSIKIGGSRKNLVSIGIPIPFLFVKYGTWDRNNMNCLGPDVSSFIQKRYLSKINGEYNDPVIMKSASLSLFVAVTPTFETIPAEFSQFIKIINIPSLSDEEIKEIISESLNNNGIEVSVIGENRLDEMVIQLRGFSRLRIRTFVKSMIINRSITCESSNWSHILESVYSSKKEVLATSKGLKWEITDGPQAIGLDNTESWLSNRAPLFGDISQSIAHGYDIPKGILLSGIPGSGKSLMAKEAARLLGLPLISLDMGAIRGGIVGESEHNMIAELKLAESMAPCVLWIDEIEKAFSGSSSSSGENGVSQRLFGKFLTWLQEKKSACFVFATANDITSLPPEFFRSERFDRKFYTFFPTVKECAAIISSYIKSANEKYNPGPGDPTMAFDPNLTDDTIWKQILNEVCASDNEFSRIRLIHHKESDRTLHRTDSWHWSKTTKPKVKIFSGADLSAIIKEAMFLVRMENGEVGNYSTTHKGNYRYNKQEFINAVKTVIEGKEDASILEFKPYGETNQKDIAKCFIKLCENQFQAASSKQLFDLSSFDREECKYDLPTEPTEWDVNTVSNDRYDIVLFCLVVGAVNQYAKDILTNTTR